MNGIYDSPDHIQDGLGSSLHAPSSDCADPLLVGLTRGYVVNQGGVDLERLMRGLATRLPIISSHELTCWEVEIVRPAVGAGSSGVSVLAQSDPKTAWTYSRKATFGAASQDEDQIEVATRPARCAITHRPCSIEIGQRGLDATVNRDEGSVGATKGRHRVSTRDRRRINAHTIH